MATLAIRTTPAVCELEGPIMIGPIMSNTPLRSTIGALYSEGRQYSYINLDKGGSMTEFYKPHANRGMGELENGGMGELGSRLVLEFWELEFATCTPGIR